MKSLQIRALALILLSAGVANGAPPVTAPPEAKPAPVTKAALVDQYVKGDPHWDRIISSMLEQQAKKVVMADKRIPAVLQDRMIHDLVGSIPHERFEKLALQKVDELFSEEELRFALTFTDSPLIKKWTRLDLAVFDKWQKVLGGIFSDAYEKTTHFKFEATHKPSSLTLQIWKLFPDTLRPDGEFCPAPLAPQALPSPSRQGAPPPPPAPSGPSTPGPQRAALIDEYLRSPKYKKNLTFLVDGSAENAVTADPRIPLASKAQLSKDLAAAIPRGPLLETARAMVNKEYSDQELQYLTEMWKYSFTSNWYQVEVMVFENWSPVAEEMVKANYETITHHKYQPKLARGWFTRLIWKWFPETVNPDLCD